MVSFEKVEEILKKNRKTINGYEFTMPSFHEYTHQWLWDSCFHAIALRHFDVKAAENELKSLMASQHKNGMVPHESKYSILGIKLPFTSRITQPPFIARATFDTYQTGENKNFLHAMFPKLRRYYKWLEENREADNVLTFVNPFESGKDNSIMWDTKIHLLFHFLNGVDHAYHWLAMYMPIPQLHAIKSVSATAVYADALECMGKIAGILGNSKLQNYYRSKHDRVIQAMRKTFVRGDGVYYNLTLTNKPFLNKTHIIFMPLFSGTLTKLEARKLVQDHLLNKREFWTKFPIPTVAINEEKFSPTHYWRGPTWVNINWMVYRGLLRYGFKSIAKKLLSRTISAIEKSGFREYFNPLTGKGLGAREFTWGALVLDMMKDYIR